MNVDETTVDGICEALSHPTRRALLRRLRETETSSVETVAAELATSAVDGGERAGGAGDADRVEIALHHVHLPKMADAGLIEYAPGTGSIGTSGLTDASCRLLDALEG